MFDAPLDEDVRDGDADNDGEDDGDTVDAEAQRLEQFLDGDGLDVEDGEEETIEEDTGDERDNWRDDEKPSACGCPNSSMRTLRMSIVTMPSTATMASSLFGVLNMTENPPAASAAAIA